MTIITRQCLEHLGMSYENSTYAIQGMGNVGGTAAQILYDKGCEDCGGQRLLPQACIMKTVWHIPAIRTYLSDKTKGAD